MGARAGGRYGVGRGAVGPWRGAQGPLAPLLTGTGGDRGGAPLPRRSSSRVFSFSVLPQPTRCLIVSSTLGGHLATDHLR